MYNYIYICKAAKTQRPEFKARQLRPARGQTVAMQPSNLPPALHPRLLKSVPEIGPGAASA